MARAAKGAEAGSDPMQIGPYRVEGRLGRGGMGVVYRAYDPRLDRPVALKRLELDDAQPQEARRHFRREARLAARLSHPAIVQVHDWVEGADGDWIVMELVEGRSLEQLLVDGPPPHGRAARIARDVASGLAAAHDAGLVHRDLKAGNVMINDAGEVKILDFGLAERVRRQSGVDLDRPVSEADRIAGTVAAMSPEQAMGQPVDHRSDLFSLGTLLYELLTGESPFEGSSAGEVLTRLCTVKETPVARRAPAVPEALSRLVERLLEKDPARRPASAREVASALEPWAGGAAGPTSGPAPPAEALRLRRRPPPPMPARPFPVFLPYDHPALFAGREREIAELRRRLREPVPVLGLFAPSGTGKSSLLAAGLVPALRRAGVPVALARHPHERGALGRLLDDLLEDPADRDRSLWAESDGWRGFVDRLREVERLAGTAPILVLDHFEQVLGRPPADRPPDASPEAPPAEAARALIGAVMAATARRRPGTHAPPCRWLLAYRQEFHGRLSAWLRDVLYDAESAGLEAIEVLPRDLSTPERFQSLPLKPLGSPAGPAPGAAGPERGSEPEAALGEAMEVFRSVIEKPLALRRSEGSPRYPWRFAARRGVDRLARAFAEARVARPEAPLAPELQVVLAHLSHRAGESGMIEVPDDPGRLIAEALEEHLRRALEAAFPAGGSAASKATARTGRARALLALRELAWAPDRAEGLAREALRRAIGDGAEELLAALATPLTRLLVLRRSAGGWRYALSHDRMAEVIVRLVEEEWRLGKLEVDVELVALNRFVALQTALYREHQEPATRVGIRRYRRIERHAGSLLWDPERRAWWQACRKRRRRDRRRRAASLLVASVLLVLAAWGPAQLARQWRARQALLEQVAEGKPEDSLRAFVGLAEEPGTDFAEVRSLLRRREIPMDVLERGLGTVDRERRGAVVLQAVELALPWVEETPEDPVLVANLAWALDVGPGRDPRLAGEARALRERVLTPVRSIRPPPPFPDPADPDWVPIPAGRFVIGRGDGGNDDEGPAHEVAVPAFRLLRREVTNAEYRRLEPEHAGAADLPAAGVTWYEAYAYAAWLGGRLPTEAEWEVAARAGCRFVHCTREGLEATVDEVAWTLRNTRDPVTGAPSARPVMRLEPNPWGLYDMLGNLWEWTADWHGAYPTGPRPDPWGPVTPGEAGERVDRGGSYVFGKGAARVETRSHFTPATRYEYLGFRVALIEPPPPGAD